MKKDKNKEKLLISFGPNYLLFSRVVSLCGIT